jgi:hypothetical protein
MKNGIIQDNEGFDILVNDTSRTFRDVREVALASALYLKSRNNGNDKVQVRDRSNGKVTEILADGRLR